MSATNSTLLFRGNIVLPDRVLTDSALLCVDGIIAAVGKAQSIGDVPEATIIDAGDGYIAPGFVDQHLHGALGADFMDGSVEAVETAIQGHTRYGTTSLLPTTTTGTPEQIAAMLDCCQTVKDNWQPGKHARLTGVHFYGPYFATDKVGAHPKGYERDPDPAEYMAAFERGIVKVATCAAELPGAEAFYAAAYKHGCLVTCGHSNASYAEMQRGYNVGLRHVDHFWCAMSNVSSVSHRLGAPMQASMTEFVLGNLGMSTEILADGEHVASDLLTFTYNTLGPDRLILVTDSNRAVGMPKGDYMIGNKDTGQPFTNNGKVGIGPDGGLASTVHGMDHMVRIMVRDTPADLVHAIRMASLSPAKLMKIDTEVGSLAVDKFADVQLLDNTLHTKHVWIGGKQWQAPAS